MSNISNAKKLLWACLCVIGAACSKTSTTPESNTNPTPPDKPSENVKLYPVRFSIGDVDVTNERTASRVVPARSYLQYLYYAAYDSTGRLASKIVQDSTGKPYRGYEFGIFKDSLPAGRYTVVLMGTSMYGAPELDNSDSSLSTLYIRTVGEVFYNKFTIKVNDKDTLTSAVKISRINGQIELNLTDTLPEPIKRVSMVYDRFPMRYYPAGDTCGYLYQVDWGYDYKPKEQTWYAPRMDFFGTDKPYKIRIVGSDADGQLLCEKVLENIYVYPNKKTVLNGTLKIDNTGNMSVSVETDYSDTIIHNFRRK